MQYNEAIIIACSVAHFGAALFNVTSICVATENSHIPENQHESTIYMMAKVLKFYNPKTDYQVTLH